jgi:hypothetical protein
LKRLQGKTSHYNVDGWLEEYGEKERILNRISQYPPINRSNECLSVALGGIEKSIMVSNPNTAVTGSSYFQ